MSNTATAKLRRRAERAERLAVAFGFLLKRLHAQYSDDFGIGFYDQMRHALRDLHDLERSIAQRAAPSSQEAP